MFLMKLTKREFEIMTLLTTLPPVGHKKKPASVEASEKLGISRPNLQNYVSRLHGKGFILQTEQGRAACREFLASYVPVTGQRLNARQLALLKRYAAGETYLEIAQAMTAEAKAHPNPKKRKIMQISSVMQALCNCMALIGEKQWRGDERTGAAHRWLTENGYIDFPRPLPRAHRQITINHNGIHRQLFNVYALLEEGEIVYIGATPHLWERALAHKEYYPKYTTMKVLHGSSDPQAIWKLMDEEIAKHHPRDNRPDYTAYRNGKGHAMPPRKSPAYDPTRDPANY